MALLGLPTLVYSSAKGRSGFAGFTDFCIKYSKRSIRLVLGSPALCI